MDIETFLGIVQESLRAIVEPRFYKTERGFQGQLLVELSRRLPDYLFQSHAVIEQEHQKTVQKHNLKIRPDIIIHQPFDSAIHTSRRDGNFAVIALKLKAGPKRATEDFVSLQSMLTVLHYPIGIFINISHSLPHEKCICTGAHGRIIAFATRLKEGHVQVIEARA